MKDNHFPKLRNLFQRISGRLKFASGGLTLSDKLKSFYLGVAMEESIGFETTRMKNFASKRHSPLFIRHKNFNYFKIKYDLADQYQMSISKEFLLDRVYDLSYVPFHPKQIVDCGAYRGYFTLLASKAFPAAEITSVEPHPTNFTDLMQNLNQNRVSHVTLLNKAISKAHSSIRLFTEGSVGSINSIVQDGNHVEVETIDLNTLIKPNLPLLLKVDVEGAELEFFPEIIATLPQKAFVFLETHDGMKSLPSIQQAFQENGFEFCITTSRDIYIDSYAYRL